MNSHLATVMSVMDGILLDASTTWPTATRALGKDLSYLRRAAEERGLAFFTLTLPDLGKVIDRSLAHGSFLASEVPKGIPLIKKRPKLFGELYMKVFDTSGVLLDSPDPNAILFLRQLCYVAKKYRIACDPSRVEETISGFFSTEENVPPCHPGTWDSNIPDFYPLYGHPKTPVWEERYDYVPDSMDVDYPWDDFRNFAIASIASLGDVDWWDLRPKHGPGVVSEQTGFVSKYEFPIWPQKLDQWFPYDWFATGILSPVPEYSREEPPSRLIAVPKTQKGPRLICAEPLAHQWMQQGIWWWLRRQIRRSPLGHAIRFEDQEYSRERALSASSDGSFCTIDLSEASDRLSARLVHYVFQKHPLIEGLHACRTRYLMQELSQNHPKVIKLKKFAPMGSAVTFPIQSIVFAIISAFAIKRCKGSESDLSDLKGDYEQVSVFGDDIIAPTYAYDAIAHLLSECGLKVNPDKSFKEGFFRESCGMDAFGGINVTPAYLLSAYDGSPNSMAATIETCNNFHKSGFWNAAQAVADQIPYKEKKLLPIISDKVGGLGLFSFCGSSKAHLRKVWNAEYQREESIALDVTSKVTKAQGRGLSGLTQYFTERPDPLVKWKSGQVRTVKLRKSLTRV